MAKSNRPEPSEFLVFPIVDLDLMVFFRGSDITRPLYVSYKEFVKQITQVITPASALLLQTNSVNNPTQTLLNLIQGSGITITDDGLGGITITATGGGGTYTVDNGLTENPANNFQLGGTLLQNTDIVNAGFYLRFTQSSGKALELYSNNAEALLAERANTSRNTVDTVLRLVRESTTNPLGIWTQSGFGAGIDFDLMMSNGTTVTAGNISSRWNSPISPSESSFLTFSTRSAGTLTVQMGLYSTGALNLASYGVGTFLATPAYALGVDAFGDVVEFTASPTTGDSISPFLLMGG
jgi:hypothetical protein